MSYKVRSPVFFGKLSGGLTRLEAVRGEGNLAALKALKNGVAFGRFPEDEHASPQQEAVQQGNRIRSTCLVGGGGVESG